MRTTICETPDIQAIDCCPDCGGVLVMQPRRNDMGIPFYVHSCAACTYVYSNSPVKCKNCF